jgi:hypothetical protein
MHLQQQQQSSSFWLYIIQGKRCSQWYEQLLRLAPSIRVDRADTRAAASVPLLHGFRSWCKRLPHDNHHLSEYQIAIRQHLEIFEAKQEGRQVECPRPEDTGLPRPSRHSMPSLCKPEAA